MPFLLEHKATFVDEGEFESTYITNSVGDQYAGWDMEFSVGIKEDGSQQIQAIIASATDWTVADFKHWLENHGFGDVQVEEVSNEPKTQMADMPTVRWRQNSDHTCDVFEVPIFKLGTHRGFDYSSAWANRAIGNFKDDKRQGELPSLIVGHTEDDGTEKPAVGFADNLRLKGDWIFADFVKLSRKVFQELRQGMWPKRSVEAWDDAARITAVALLGGTRPYHKFDLLGNFSEGTGQWFDWGSSEEGIRMPGKTEQPPADGGTNTATPPDGGGAPSVDPAKFAETETRLETLESERAAQDAVIAGLRETNRQGDVARFHDNLRGLGFAPAIVDSTEVHAVAEHFSRSAEPMKFSDSDTEVELTGLPALERVLGLIAEQAGKNALMVPKTGQTAQFGDVEHPDDETEQGKKDGKSLKDAQKELGSTVDPASVKFRDEVEALAKMEEISFEAAFVRLRREQSDN